MVRLTVQSWSLGVVPTKQKVQGVAELPFSTGTAVSLPRETIPLSVVTLRAMQSLRVEPPWPESGAFWGLGGLNAHSCSCAVWAPWTCAGNWLQEGAALLSAPSFPFPGTCWVAIRCLRHSNIDSFLPRLYTLGTRGGMFLILLLEEANEVHGVQVALLNRSYQFEMVFCSNPDHINATSLNSGSSFCSTGHHTIA